MVIEEQALPHRDLTAQWASAIQYWNFPHFFNRQYSPVATGEFRQQCEAPER